MADDARVTSPPNTGLESVSCAAPDSCVAVGGATPASGFVPVAELWNGTEWIEHDPPSIDNTELQAVSCPATDSCIATGGGGESGVIGRGPLTQVTDIWNGRSWAAQGEPSNIAVEGITCPSATTMCLAVGSAGYPARPGAEIWNGADWSAQATAPIPANSYGAYLDGISCPSESSCFAVGSIEDRIGLTSTPLVEHWNGRGWTSQSVPGGTRGNVNWLTGVSCVSGDHCVAVGFSGEPQSGTDASGPLAMQWNGSKWESMPIPGRQFDLRSVSCTSEVVCAAVGGGDLTGGSTQIEVLDGDSWAIEPNPASRLAASRLLGVSCEFPLQCTAVGLQPAIDGQGSPLTETNLPPGNSTS